MHRGVLGNRDLVHCRLVIILFEISEQLAVLTKVRLIDLKLKLKFCSIGT